LGNFEPDEAKMQRVIGTSDAHIRVNGTTVAHEGILLKEDTEIGPREELRRMSA
jgi:hypothetical protein